VGLNPALRKEGEGRRIINRSIRTSGKRKRSPRGRPARRGRFKRIFRTWRMVGEEKRSRAAGGLRGKESGTFFSCQMQISEGEATTQQKVVGTPEDLKKERREENRDLPRVALSVKPSEWGGMVGERTQKKRGVLEGRLNVYAAPSPTQPPRSCESLKAGRA